MRALIALLCITICLPAHAAKELWLYQGPFDLQINQVKSLAPQTRVGLGKSLPVYTVEAESAGMGNPRMRFVLACVSFSPEAGKIYKVSEEFASDNFSPLKLWPMERSSVPHADTIPKKGEKYLFRVLIFQDVKSKPISDVVCDVRTEAPKLTDAAVTR